MAITIGKGGICAMQKRVGRIKHQHGRFERPSANPTYLLGHNEVLELFRDFRVLWCRQGQCSEVAGQHFEPMFAQKSVAFHYIRQR